MGTPATGIEVDKTGMLVLGGNGTLEPGDTIDYSFEVTNTGMLFIETIIVSDTIVATITCPSGNPIPMLNGGESETCTGTYVITQADIDAGTVDNTATVEGVVPEITDVMDTDMHARPLAPRVIDLEVVKDASAVVAPVMPVGPGDIFFNYTFEVTNSGNVTLLNISVTDDVVSPVTCPSGNPIPTLAPGDSETCTGGYGPDQDDFDNATIVNTVTAMGTTALNEMASDTDQNTELLPQAPDIEIVKDGSLDLGMNGTVDVGDTINYTFLLSNTGNLTLSNVAVTDDLVAPVTCPSGNPIPMLAPGEMETCSGSYALTGPDILAGQVDNTATAEGDNPIEGSVSDTDEHSQALPAVPVDEVEEIPILDGWGLVLLSLTVLSAGLWKLRAP